VKQPESFSIGIWKVQVLQNFGTLHCGRFQRFVARSLHIISSSEVSTMLPALSSDFPSTFAQPQNDIVPSESTWALISGSAHCS
jgi:hypothetical protein